MDERATGGHAVEGTKVIVFLKSHPAVQGMIAARAPVDLNEPSLRRSPGEPDAGQSASGKYRKPRVEWQGLTIAIENPAGSVRRGRTIPDGSAEALMLARRFADVRAPILAIGIDDDPFGTVPALDRLLDYYTGSDRHHLRLAPATFGQSAIGHFAFFHERFRDVLWPLALEWLQTGRPPTHVGALHTRAAQTAQPASRTRRLACDAG